MARILHCDARGMSTLVFGMTFTQRCLGQVSLQFVGDVMQIRANPVDGVAELVRRETLA